MNQPINNTRNLNTMVLEANLKTGEIIRHESPVRLNSTRGSLRFSPHCGLKS
ncbi:hypothetical protein HOF92_05425 [bacterium]|nr:hypothetical protein [bacterium]